jgi:hypothetical protein
MWAGSILLGVVEGIWEGGNQGGPRKWEAQEVRDEKELRRKSWLLFTFPSFLAPTDHP